VGRRSRLHALRHETCDASLHTDIYPMMDADFYETVKNSIDWTCGNLSQCATVKLYRLSQQVRAIKQS
jgi:hypothetical protein